MPESAAVSTPLHSRKNLCTIVWLAALVLAVINVLAVVHRLPIQFRQEIGAEEAAAQQAARWMADLPSSARVAVLLSHGDRSREWYSIRLNYLTYPRPHTVVWERLPSDAGERYDAVLTFGVVHPSLPPSFTISKQVPLASIALPDTNPVSVFTGKASTLAAKPLPLLPQLGMGLVSLAGVVLLGALLLGFTMRDSPFSFWWANLALAHLTGAAALAWIETTAIALAGRPLLWPVYLLLALLLVLLPFRQRRHKQEAVPFTQEPPKPIGQIQKREWLLLGLIVWGACTAVERGWLFGIGWDAYSIWQLTAKVLFLDGSAQALHSGRLAAFSHLDYPLLMPLQTWWTYRHIGGVHDRWAQGIGFCFYLDLLAVFLAGAMRFVNRTFALVGLSVLAGLPVLTNHATSGFADIGVAAYFLAVNVCLALVLVRREHGAGVLLGWLLVGLALTKNEGTPACAGVLLVGGFYALRGNRAEKRAAMTRWLLWTGVAVLALLPWTLYKRQWGLSNDVLSSVGSAHFGIRLLLWRMGYALWYGFGKQLAFIGP